MRSFHARSALLALTLSSLHLCASAVAPRTPQQFAAGTIAVIFTPLASHWYQFKPIIEELVLRGHQVKVCVPFA